ncbi:MAG: TonB-dependent receptor [Fidelibacterota bacterium]|nr:MAG: TonB-dependent receptor [Candidatus Neomarinimicrobiota bacterium]
MINRGLTALLAAFMVPFLLWAQTGTIIGTVTEVASGDPLAGANVVVEGTTFGAAADFDGNFTIANVPEGNYTVTASVIGFVPASLMASLTAGATVTLNFGLEPTAIALTALEVMASRATRETPVAFTNISKAEMDTRLGSRDIPLVLNTTPSVYATQEGGGAGDARVNVRGFNQRNVAIMINGVPTNDMENGWLYWSNWDGLGDATSSIQMQRGLSAVNLATPSIGGTMNIITDPSAHASGGMFKQEVGAWGFMKSTLTLNTGLIGGKLALTGNIVRKTGEGYYGGTWTDAWAYYLGASYALTKKDRLELYAIGAPQRHGQNLYRQNAARYSHDFAKDLEGYDEDALADFDELGRDYNQNYNKVSSSYKGKQYWEMYTVRDGIDRHESGLLNERENYFHKPQVNLNWFHTLNDQMRLSTIVYYSGGMGGGTGTYGSVKSSSALGYARDWDAEIAENLSNVDSTYSVTENSSTGILRNSVNQQWTIGAISKLYFELSKAIKVQAGIDWRMAEIGHWREVRDLLGGDYYVYTGNQFETTDQEHMKRLGDKIAYHFTNTVDWFGLFGQGEFSSGPLTAYGMFGWSQIAYTYTNHFRKDENGDEIFSDPPSIATTQFKGGASFRLTEDLGLFGNFGIVTKPPIFDHVIDDYAGATNEDPQPENYTSAEGGAYFRGLDGMLDVNANFYYTIWNDRTMTEGVTTAAGEEGLVSITGLNATHSGIEMEGAFQPISMLRLNFAASFGNWIYTDDVAATYIPDQLNDPNEIDTLELFIKDLKVGDAPQMQIAVGASVFPITGLMAQAVLKYYDNYYADFDPLSRTTEDRTQSWKIPSSTVMDLHATYDLPFKFGGVRLQAFIHIFNLLDSEFIQDATDNSQYNGFDGDHDADDAEIFLGMPRTYNTGLTVRF